MVVLKCDALTQCLRDYIKNRVIKAPAANGDLVSFVINNQICGSASTELIKLSDNTKEDTFLSLKAAHTFFSIHTGKRREVVNGHYWTNKLSKLQYRYIL